MRSALPWLVCCTLAGCLWSNQAAKPPAEPPTINFRRERQVTPRPIPFVSVTVTRAPGALRLHVSSAQRCRIDVLKAMDTGYPDGRVERGELELESSQEDMCYGTHLTAASEVDVGLQVGPRLRVLGTTSVTGELEVSLHALDALFQEGTVEPDQVAQVLVHGVKSADLPLGEIVNRQRQVEVILGKCEQALARPDAERELLARRLAELLDLQLQGAADPRLALTAKRLYVRMAEQQAKLQAEPPPTAAAASDDSWRNAPSRWLARAKQVLGELSSTGEQAAVPETVQRDLDQPSVQPSTLDWAMGALPTVCKITVTGGAAVAATLVSTGPASIALDVVMGMLGNDLSQWLTNRCCEMAVSSVSDAESTVCDTERVL